MNRQTCGKKHYRDISEATQCTGWRRHVSIRARNHSRSMVGMIRIACASISASSDGVGPVNSNIGSPGPLTVRTASESIEGDTRKQVEVPPFLLGIQNGSSCRRVVHTEVRGRLC